MSNDVLYVDKPGLESDVSKMKHGLENFISAVSEINAGVDATPSHWKGVTKEAYFDRYNELRNTLQKDVPDAVDGMIKFLEDFIKNMAESDSGAAAALR